MSEFFKNSPMALLHCILFEVLQGNSIDQAYSNICSVIGKEVIDNKNFELSFNQFSEGKFNDKKEEKPITEILRNDKYALRACMLYEFLINQKAKLSIPIFKIFVNFCKVIGVEDVLKYPEFEYWFYRFLNGEFDLNNERDKDKKIYELMDMPLDVMKNIVEYLDIFDRAKLAKTSRSLRIFVEDQKLFHHTLKVNVSNNMATISFGKSVNIQYMNDYFVTRKITKTCKTRYSRVACWKQAILDFTSVLKNPKLHLDTLEINLNVDIEKLFNELKDELEFTDQLNVKTLILEKYSSDLLFKILPSLKPGYLTNIHILSYIPNVDLMKKVFEMEQWKQAKYFKMDNFFFICPLFNLYHLKEFHVCLKKLTVEDIRQMKEILFKSPDFEQCKLFINTEIDKSIFEQEFGNAIREDPYIYHYPIPNSTEYFEIEIEEPCIKITRKKN